MADAGSIGKGLHNILTPEAPRDQSDPEEFAA